MKSMTVAAIVLVVGLLAGAMAAFAGETTAPAAADQPAVAGKAQTTCPIMGGAINKKFYTDYNGKRVYFCCGMCPEMFAKDPEKYMKKLADEGITLEDSPSGTK